MGTIAIRLSPRDLENPDLDIRYEVPDLLEAATQGRVKPDGYDYLDDANRSMVIFLSSHQPAVDAPAVLDVLRNNRFSGNSLLPSAVVAISDDGKKYVVVHPPGSDQKFDVRA